MLVRPDAGRLRRPFGNSNPVPEGISPSRSPNGRYIAFTTSHRNAADPSLGVIDVATGKLHTIKTVGATDASPPVWSPDSKRFAVTTSFDVFTLNRDGTGARKLSIEGFPAFWSRRTGNLYIVHGNLARYVFVSAQGRPRARLLFRMPRHQNILMMDVK